MKSYTYFVSHIVNEININAYGIFYLKDDAKHLICHFYLEIYLALIYLKIGTLKSVDINKAQLINIIRYEHKF